MSQKKKAKPVGRSPCGVDGAAPAEVAAAALAAGRFKEAIEHFKELLKRERRGDWLEGLAAAYAGRAEQLASKGMVKEAIALWRTRCDTCKLPLLSARYVAWLMQSGQVEQALGLLATLDSLPAEAQSAAQSQLAAAVLVAPERLLTGLPAGNPLMQHRAAARAAIAACAQGNDAALPAALQAISHRSPYRDLRPLLKALSLQAAEPQLAEAALVRVSRNGPFEPLAKALRVCLLPGTDWLAGLQQLDDVGRGLVLDLKGCPIAQRPLVLALMVRSGEAAPVELFDLVLRHRQALAPGLARQVGLRLLPHAPQRLEVFRASLPPLAAADQWRVLALAAEIRQRPEDAESHWLRFVKAVGATPAERQGAALVLRHLADEHRSHALDGQLCQHARAWLKQSLDFDPDDQATHLSLVRDARHSGDQKQARAWLDAARLRFPDDTPLLQQAVEMALATGAYKKAAGLAKRLLQLDPINPQVRRLIGQAHLSHARKQIDLRNLQGALREIDDAAAWLREAGELGLIKLLRSLVAEAGPASDALMREAMAELGSPLVATFHLLLEGWHSKHRPKDLLRRAAVDLAAVPAAADLVALARALNGVQGRDVALRAALEALRETIERAARSPGLSDSDFVLLCEALHRHGQRALTGCFAGAALQRWPQRPVFMYFEAMARFGDHPQRMPRHEWEVLEQAFDRAEGQGDQRTATRLGKLLDEAVGPPDLGISADGNGEDEFSGDGLQAVLGVLLSVGGVDHILDLARQQLGKATFDQLRRTIKGSKKQFAQALIELLSLGEHELKSGPAGAAPIVPVAKPAGRAAPPAAGFQPGLFDD